VAKNQQITLLTDTGVGQLLESTRDQFQQVVEQSRIANVIAWQKEASIARQILLKDTRLLQSTPESIKYAITNVAVVGLTLNPIKKHATILPRWNEKMGAYEAQLFVQFQGLMWLAGQAGVTDIVSEVVYTADKFSISRTSEGDKYEHIIAFGVPRDGISSNFMGGYIAARMPGSKMMKAEWVPAEDVYKAREKSDSYINRKTGKPSEYSPWVWMPDEMYKKFFIKRGSKRWEEAVLKTDDWNRFQTAVALDNANEGIIKQSARDIPGTAEHISTGGQDDKPPEKLSMQQITELEKLAEQVAPNNDEYPNNTGHYLTKIARTYRASKLADVDATKFDEIKGRINEAIEKIKNKKAADPKAGKQQGTGQQGKPSGTTGQEKGSGGQTTSGGAKDGGQATAGGAGARGTGGSAEEREPGSDDDAGDPDRQIP
jgi:recombinational DNA repair protein RecT